MRTFADDSLTDTIKPVYENVLILELINPVEDNVAFQTEIKRRALEDYGYTFGDAETVNMFSFYILFCSEA